MLDNFNHYIKAYELTHKRENILLGVSGGIDSMVMAHLFYRAGYQNTAIAHCNFKLRSKESDKDQHFVKEWSKKLNMPFYTISFNTNEYAKNNKLSVQMAARELRYSWFEKIAVEYGYDKIAIAHNSDDSIETFFINLTRGSGLKGLTGIASKKGKIIRPIMFTSRRKIESVAKTEKIEFREDSSNASVKYYRNYIRHNIIPMFEKMNPSFRPTLIKEMEVLEQIHSFCSSHLCSIQKELFDTKENAVHISINKIKEKNIPAAILFDLLSEFNFNASDIKDIYSSLNRQPGSTFYSNSHLLIKDRDELIIKKKKDDPDNSEYLIDVGVWNINKPIEMYLSAVEHTSNFCIPEDKNIAALNKDMLNFPLIIRKWKNGDYFFPLGMRGKKKLSDYFTDHKFSLFDKKNCWLLTSGNDIIWLIGERIDDRYKIKPDTKNVLLIEIGRKLSQPPS